MPVDRPEHRLARAALNQQPATWGEFEDDNLLLHLVIEEEQAYELRDASAREPELPGNVAEVGELQALEPAAQSAREGEVPGDPRGVGALVTFMLPDRC